MGTSPRIPRGINEFGTYIASTNAYIVAGAPETNGTRLGFSADEMKQWKVFDTEYNPLLLMYNDIMNSRTRAIRNNLIEIIERVVAYDQENHLLDRIAASPNATVYDLGAFNINGGVSPKTTRTRPITPVKEAVSVTFLPLGGATIAIKCYSTTSARASIFAGADSVQYLFKTGTVPPTSANEEELKSGLSTKAMFNLVLDPEYKGKYLYIYFRWYNTRHPALSGPWSELQIIMIM
jgi:hypothetical protein